MAKVRIYFRPMNGGGGGNRTRVRKYSAQSVYMLIPRLIVASPIPAGKDYENAILIKVFAIPTLRRSGSG